MKNRQRIQKQLNIAEAVRRAIASTQSEKGDTYYKKWCMDLEDVLTHQEEEKTVFELRKEKNIKTIFDLRKERMNNVV